MTGRANRQPPNDDVGKRAGHLVFDRMQDGSGRVRHVWEPDALPAQGSVRSGPGWTSRRCRAWRPAHESTRGPGVPGRRRLPVQPLLTRPRNPRRGVGWCRSGTAVSSARVSRRRGRRAARDAARGGVFHASHRDRALPRRPARDHGFGGGPSARARRAGCVRARNDAAVDQRDIALRVSARDGNAELTSTTKSRSSVAAHPCVRRVGSLVRVGRADQHAPAPRHDDQQAAAGRRRAQAPSARRGGS